MQRSAFHGGYVSQVIPGFFCLENAAHDFSGSVDQTKVHKVPEQKGGQWIQVPRYEWKDLGTSHVVP